MPTSRSQLTDLNKRYVDVLLEPLVKYGMPGPYAGLRTLWESRHWSIVLFVIVTALTAAFGADMTKVWFNVIAGAAGILQSIVLLCQACLGNLKRVLVANALLSALILVMQQQTEAPG